MELYLTPAQTPFGCGLFILNLPGPVGIASTANLLCPAHSHLERRRIEPVAHMLFKDFLKLLVPKGLQGLAMVSLYMPYICFCFRDSGTQSLPCGPF